MATWAKQKLGDVVEFIDGDRGKQYPTQGDFYPAGACLFLSTANIPNSKFDFNNKVFITAKKDSELRKGKLKRNDYVLTTRGTVGNFAFYGNKVPFENLRLNSGMVILRKKSENLEEKYLQYFLSSDLFQNQVKARTSGSAQPQLPIRDMVSIAINLPDIKTQQKIADVLSAYDDLIENNEKRIRILEEMAQRLYTEWFVKFKFPLPSVALAKEGRRQLVKMVDSGTEYGMIPEGWEVKRLGDVVQIRKGKNITKDTVTMGKIPVVAGGLAPAYYHNQANTNWPVVTVSASGANAGFINLYYENIWVSDCSYIDRNITEYVYFLYLFLKQKKAEIKQLQRGSAQPHVYPKDLMQLSIIGYPESLMADFEKKVGKFFELVGKLKNENNILIKTRDLLIPQLITGKREVK